MEVAECQEENAFRLFEGLYFLYMVVAIVAFALAITANSDREWTIKWKIDGSDHWTSQMWAVPLVFATIVLCTSGFFAAQAMRFASYAFGTGVDLSPMDDATSGASLNINVVYADVNSRGRTLFMYKTIMELAFFILAAHISAENQLGNVLIGGMLVALGNACLANIDRETGILFKLFTVHVLFYPWLFAIINISTETRSDYYMAAFWVMVGFILAVNLVCAGVLSMNRYRYLLYSVYGDTVSTVNASAPGEPFSFAAATGGYSFNMLMAAIYFCMALGAGIPAFMGKGDLQATVSYNIGDSEKINRQFEAGKIVYFVPAFILFLAHLTATYHKDGMLKEILAQDWMHQRVYSLGHFAFAIAEALLFLHVASAGGITEVGELVHSCVFLFAIALFEFCCVPTMKANRTILQRGTEIAAVVGAKLASMAPYALALASACVRDPMQERKRAFTAAMFGGKILLNSTTLFLGKHFANSEDRGGCLGNREVQEETRVRSIAAVQFMFVTAVVIGGYAGAVFD